MQIRGRNFLIPVGANIEHEDEVSYQALDAQAVMDKMESEPVKYSGAPERAAQTAPI